MILLDKNNEPTNTVYYISGISYGLLNKHDGLDILSLYDKVSDSIENKVNFTFVLMAIDFLYMANKIYLDDRGDIHVYKKSKNSKRHR
ncbi:ABC-three component system middle component 6 [Companilactobacillus paralimentarius]|uniref:ABC-three component system middle component 6 n=1 Tax=Companilactobacillus paralimentarius TaxID=83526 RepID=UPI0037E06A4F